MCRIEGREGRVLTNTGHFARGLLQVGRGCDKCGGLRAEGSTETKQQRANETRRSGRRSDRGLWSLLNWPKAPRDAARPLIVSVPFICRGFTPFLTWLFSSLVLLWSHFPTVFLHIDEPPRLHDACHWAVSLL
ncbi:hypothetical protein BJY00DRAFT_56176 [Aspergillus carlsbadensis]|nr:hypothetical protein BJY00DRAFT_56176 [Aspergillus carlsbadensis]